MGSPLVRLVFSLALLWLYHVALLDHPLPDSLGPSSAALDRALGASRDAFAAGRFEDALPPTLEVVDAMPGQAVFLERLALIYRALDRPVEEARSWESYVDASGTPVDACPMLPEAYRRQEDAAAALDAYERCLAFDPKNVDMLLFLGQAYLRAGRKKEARSVLERGLGFAGQYDDYHLVLGVLDYSEGDVRGARSRFERFLELAPKRRGEVAQWLERTRAGG